MIPVGFYEKKIRKRRRRRRGILENETLTPFAEENFHLRTCHSEDTL
jgi:hypothetical protein